MANNVLVTGGAGYIGSHICKRLAKDGFCPITIDNLYRGNKSLVKWGPLFQKDIRDHQSIKEIIYRYNPIGVIHLAALCYVEESIHQPLIYYDNNVIGSLTLIKTILECGINHLVFSSSCSVYGIPEEVPVLETSSTAPINPYGRTKLIIEQTLGDIHWEKLNYISLRYFNVAGADPDMETGELHNPETRLIPLAINSCLFNQHAIIINGMDYSTKDGTCIRDYVHVSDLAIGHVVALKRLLEGDIHIPRIMNLGSGKGYSNFNIIQRIEELTGKKVLYKIGPRREGDPPTLIADISLSKKFLRWAPDKSDLDSILKSTIGWQEKVNIGTNL